jgi:hypothetical protein
MQFPNHCVLSERQAINKIQKNNPKRNTQLPEPSKSD